MVLHSNAIIIIGSFTHTGVAWGNSDTMKPNIANGNKQYPTALIDWNSELLLWNLLPFVAE